MPHGGARANAGRPRILAAGRPRRSISDRAKEIEQFMDAVRYEDNYKALRMLFIRKTREHVGNAAARLVTDYAADENQSKEALKAICHRPVPVSRENALSILLHVDLSVHQYQTLRTLINNATKFKNLLPSYTLVRKYKINCAPVKDDTLYLERRAEVVLQDLLNHTSERAIESDTASIQKAVSRRRGRVDCEFLVTWGLDGASEQLQWNQRHKDTNNIGKSDDSLIAVVINPIRLKTKRGICLWENPACQSHLFVRPLILEFEKESEDYVKRMKAYVDAQIHALLPNEVELDDGTVLRIRFRMLASMIDGKVFCYFMDKPFSSCPICSADRRALSTYSRHIDTETFRPCLEALIYGLQVLHAWINFVSFLIKMPLRQARDEEKRAAARERLLRAECRRRGKEAWRTRLAEIKSELLRHDIHLATTVTGNMARVLLSQRPELLENIMGIDRRIIQRFRTILICINTTRYKLKPVDFQKYCDETRDLYLRLYPQYPLSPTIHKVLEHAVQVQTETRQKLGEISEGASESSHRVRKMIRLRRARKTSKKDNLTDIMDRCLHLSDPKLSFAYSTCLTKYRNRRRRHAFGQIPDEAQDLLTEDDEPTPPPSPTVAARNPRSRAQGHSREQGPNLNVDEQEEDIPAAVDLIESDQAGSDVNESDESENEENLTDSDSDGNDLTDDDISENEDTSTDE